MSKISTIYDGILTRLTATLPAPRTRIPNPFDLGENPNQFLVSGWALRYEGGERRPFEICRRRESETFTVILTREVIRLESRQDGFDAVGKELMEDAKLVRDAFYTTDNAGIPDIMHLDVTSISPLRQVRSGKYNLLTIECTIVADYFLPVT